MLGRVLVRSYETQKLGYVMVRSYDTHRGLAAYRYGIVQYARTMRTERLATYWYARTVPSEGRSQKRDETAPYGTVRAATLFIETLMSYLRTGYAYRAEANLGLGRHTV